MREQKETIKERLKRLRLEKGLTQEALGKKVFVSASCVSNWENGERIPDLEHLKRLRTVFGVSVDYLLCLDDYRKPQNVDIGKPLGLSEKSVETLKHRKDIEVNTDKALIATVRDFPHVDENGMKALNALIVNNIQTRFLESLYDYLFFDEPVLIVATSEDLGLKAPINKRHDLYVMDKHGNNVSIRTEHLHEINKQIVLNKLQALRDLTQREEALNDGKH